jgi:glycosyltransferase involved in cell wall biosynthesis
MPVNPITVSVIIPAYNASATIGRALEALSRQDYLQGFEVIVVDDGSPDKTGDIVRSFPAVRYVRQDNAGPASARNHGARLAKGEYLAFTDSDCLAHPDWISRLMAGFAGEKVGVVAGSYGIANPESRLARGIYKEILWRHTHLMSDYPGAFGSYNFCIRKSVFDRVGGFDTGYRRASGEDNDLSYKITQSGARIYFQRQALVDHYHTVRVGKYLKEQFQHGFWRLKMYMDHPRMMRGDGYTFWKDMVEIPLAASCLAAVPLSACHALKFSDAARFLLLPFFIFETAFACFVTRSFLEGIVFGCVLLLRAFARLFGLSTGILFFLVKKTCKIFQ